jgi:hypothetical protein
LQLSTVTPTGIAPFDPAVRHLRGRVCPISGGTRLPGRSRAGKLPSEEFLYILESLTKGSRVVVVGRLQQRSWTAEDGSARSTVEVVAEELGPSLRWATTTTTRTTRSQSH